MCSATVHRHPSAREQSPPLFEPTIAGHIEGDPEPQEYLVEGLFPKKEVSLISAGTGKGKTRLMMQLLISTALGKPWLGRKTVQGKGLAFFTEDSGPRLHEMRDAICEHPDYNVHPSVLDESVLWTPRGRPSIIYECESQWSYKGGPTPLWLSFRAHHDAWKENLIILDNAGTVFGGKTEEQIRFFLLWLIGEAEQMDNHIAVIHHPPKDGTSWFSGPGAWGKTVRYGLSVESPPPPDPKNPPPWWEDDGKRVLVAAKGSYIPWDDPLRSKSGVPLRMDGSVFVAQPIATRFKLNRLQMAELCAKVLKAVKGLVDKDEKVYRAPSAFKSFPSRVARATNTWAFCDPMDASDAIEELIEAGRLLAVDIGIKSLLLRAPDQPALLGERSSSVMAEAAE